MQAMPRPVRRAQASTAADADRPDKRALKATCVPKGVVAGSSIFEVRSSSGAAARAVSAALSAVDKVAKAPTWIIQRPGGGPGEKATGRAILSWIGRDSVAYRMGPLVTGGAIGCALTAVGAEGSIDCATTGARAGDWHGRVGS